MRSYRYALKLLPARLYFFLALACGHPGCAETFDHDAMSAGKKAQEFATVAFIQQDADRSYGLLADATRRYVPLGQFKEVVLRLHPKAFPAAVKAVEYEPMKGEKAIYIYLTGENRGESFYYRITMSGTAETNYKVLRFDRSSEPYAPTADKQPLPAISNIKP